MNQDLGCASESNVVRLYRGAGLDSPLGFWWTTLLSEAEEFARVHRNHLVLCVEVTPDFARQHLAFDDKGWYRITHEHLVTQTLAVTVIGGRIGFPVELITRSLP